MASKWREIAKFLSGIAFHETLGHWWLGIWGRDLLPWEFETFTFTSDMNRICMALWPLVFSALVWWGWLSRPGDQPFTEGTSAKTDPQH